MISGIDDGSHGIRVIREKRNPDGYSEPNGLASFWNECVLFYR